MLQFYALSFKKDPSRADFLFEPIVQCMLPLGSLSRLTEFKAIDSKWYPALIIEKIVVYFGKGAQKNPVTILAFCQTLGVSGGCHPPIPPPPILKKRCFMHQWFILKKYGVNFFGRKPTREGGQGRFGKRSNREGGQGLRLNFLQEFFVHLPLLIMGWSTKDWTDRLSDKPLFTILSKTH